MTPTEDNNKTRIAKAIAGSTVILVLLLQLGNFYNLNLIANDTHAIKNQLTAQLITTPEPQPRTESSHFNKRFDHQFPTEDLIPHPHVEGLLILP